jgi:NADP-dependent 3-hydroxy acid dehydrogenase YdfG
VKLAAGMTAVVTGAASGIGQALASLLIARGLTVAVADIEAVSDPFDVADPAAVDAFAARVGPVDLLCNVAGVVGPRVPTWEQRPVDWQWLWQVNVFGVANMLRAFLPSMVARGTGHVVNVASIAGLAPIAGGGNAPYAASKFAIVGLSETLRVELDAAAPDIGVTVVCPGPVATRIRSSERNRPVSLGGGSTFVEPTFTNAAASIGADEAAAQIVAAVEEDRFYLLTNPANAVEVRAKVDRLLADLPSFEG